jgi:4-hydroxy-tetrahydrodipicolinate synthase
MSAAAGSSSARNQTIRGNWATLLLPIQADDVIDFELLAVELDHFVEAQVDGVYSNGSACEFYAQDEDEFDRVSALLAYKCSSARVPFQIGICHTSAQTALARIRRVRSLQPVAFQVILPDWFPPTLSEVLDFLQRIAEEADPIPLIIYNPGHAKRRLSPAEWETVADQVRGVAGMKVPAGDDAWYQAMQPVMRRLSVFVPGHLMAEGLARGAQGSYSNVACLNPEGAQRWFRLCLEQPDKGRLLGERIQRFVTRHVKPLIIRDGLSNMAADKALAVAGGWLPRLTTRLRWPYRSVSEEAAQGLGTIARSELPELFEPGHQIYAS